MKTWLTILALSLLALAAGRAAEPNTNAVVVTDQQVAQWLQQGYNLARSGYFDDAERLFRQILAARPQQADARRLLKQIEDRRRELDPGGPLRRQLEQIKLAEVEFRDAEPAAVINFLRDACDKATTNKVSINFVWQVPLETKLPGVTLNLRNVSAYEVVQYVATATGLRLRFDEHAVVLILPTPGAAR